MCLCMVFALTVKACETEHANLLCDVVPGPWCPQFLEFRFQLSPHQQNPVSHGLHIVLPRVKEIQKSILRKKKKKVNFYDCYTSCSALSILFRGIICADHSLKSSGELRVVATMRAPWDGGLDQVVLTIFSIWDKTRIRLSASWATTVRLPTRSSDGTNTSNITQYCSYYFIYMLTSVKLLWQRLNSPAVENWQLAKCKFVRVTRVVFRV